MLLNLSAYTEKLKKEVKVCYKEKIALIKGIDPFVGNVTEGELFDGYSPVEDCDLVSYLLVSLLCPSLRPEKDWMHTTNLCAGGLRK